MKEKKVLTASGGTKIGRALRAHHPRPDPHLKRITKKRQEYVRRSLKEGRLHWLGNRNHFKSERGRSRHSTSPSPRRRRRGNEDGSDASEALFTKAKSDLFDDQDDGTELSAFIEEIIRLGEKSILLAPADDDSERPTDAYDFDFIWQNKRGIIREEMFKWDIVECKDLMSHFIDEVEGRGLQCLRSSEEAKQSLLPPPSIKEASLQKGDRVYAMCQEKGKYYGLYYPGQIIDVHQRENDESDNIHSDPTTYLYQIKFDDDDMRTVEEFYVFLLKDWEIWTERWDSTHDNYNAQKKAKGIQFYEDKSEGVINWNSKRGWWETELTGDVCYSSIVSAMRAYDDFYVREHGGSTRRQDLNLPEEWTFPPNLSQDLHPAPKQSREDDKNKRNSVSAIVDDSNSSRTGSVSTRTESSTSLSSAFARSSSSTTSSSDDRSDSATALSALQRLHIVNELSEMKKAAVEEKARYTRILSLMSDALPSHPEVDTRTTKVYKRMIEGEKLNMEAMMKSNEAREERLEQLLRTVDEANESSP
jgi:hypothetical protein